jgi:hypothetical protein
MIEIEQVRKDLWRMQRESSDQAIKTRCGILRNNLKLLAAYPDNPYLRRHIMRNVESFERYLTTL